MSELISSQLYAFLVYFLSGFLIGVLFDIFRVLRKSFKTPDFITCIEDAVFWLITGIFLLYIIFNFNNGEIRSYIFIGIGLGTIIYMILFSKVFIKINVKILDIFKKVIKKIYSSIIYPILKILKFIFCLIKNIIIKISNKTKNTTFLCIKKIKKPKYSKKSDVKEGF